MKSIQLQKKIFIHKSPKKYGCVTVYPELKLVKNGIYSKYENPTRKVFAKKSLPTTIYDGKEYEKAWRKAILEGHPQNIQCRPKGINLKTRFENHVVDACLKLYTSKSKQQFEQNYKKVKTLAEKYPTARKIIREIVYSHKSSQLNLGFNLFSPGFVGALGGAGAPWPSNLTDYKKRLEGVTIDAINTLDLDTDFSSATGWASTGSKFAITGGKCDFDFDADSSIHGISYDLGSAVGTKWRLEFEKHTENIGGGSNPTGDGIIGLSSANHSVGGAANQDFIGIRTIASSSNTVRMQSTDNTNPASTGGTQLTGLTFTAGESLFYVIYRDGDTIHFEVYNDIAHTDLVSSDTLAVVGTPVLQYIKLAVRDDATSGRTWNGYVDNLRFIDGNTVIENIPQKQTKLLNENFTGTDDWVDGEAATGVDTTDDEMDIVWNVSTDNQQTSYDLGANISQTNWVLDINQVNFSTLTADNSLFSFFGLLGHDASTAFNTATDAIGMAIRFQTGEKTYKPHDVDGANPIAGSESGITYTFLTGTDYWFRIIRTSSTTYSVEVFTDANRQNSLGKATGTCASTVDTLRYIVFGQRNDTSDSGVMNATIQGVDFYDKVSEVNDDLINFPANIKIRNNSDLQRRTTPTLEHLYDSDPGYVFNDSTYGFISGGKLRGGTRGDGTNDYLYFDLGSALNDTKFTAEWDMKFISITNPGSSEDYIDIGFTDTIGGQGTSQDSLVTWWAAQFDGDHDVRIDHSVAQIPQLTDNSVGPMALQFEAGDKFYVRFIRYSATHAKLFLYSDQARTKLIETLEDTGVSASVTGLRYFVVQNRFNTSHGGIMEIDIDNLRVWDNTTNPITQETATYTETGDWPDQPTADSDWSSTDTAKFRGNITNNEIDSVIAAETSNIGIAHDLQDEFGTGFVLADKFVYHQRLNFTSHASTGNATAYPIVISEKDETAGRATAQDHVALTILGLNNHWICDVGNNAGLAQAGGAAATITINDSTDYFVEIIRDGDVFTINIYSDSAYSNLLGTSTETVTSVTNLRYIKTHNHASSDSGSWNFQVDDIKIWNGVTTPHANLARAIFTEPVTTDNPTEYSSELLWYDPIAGDADLYVRYPTVDADGTDPEAYMYFDYQPTSNPDWQQPPMPVGDFESLYGGFGDNTFASGWTEVGTKVTVSGETIAWDSTKDGSNHLISKDIGQDLSNDGAGLRWKFRVNNRTAPSSGEQQVVVGIFDQDHLADDADTQDFIMFKVVNGSVGGWSFRTYDGDGIVPTGGTEDTFSLSPATATDYYMEIIRTSSTGYNMTIYSDPDYRYPIENQSGVCGAGMNPLRYVKILTLSGAANGGALDGIIDDIQVISKSSFPTRAQSVWDENYEVVYHLNGDAKDSTVNAKDGSESNVVIREKHERLGYIFNGTTSEISITSADLDQIFANGGTLEIFADPDSDGEGNFGFILGHATANNGWWWRVRNESAGAMDSQFHRDWTSDGQWEMTNNDIIIGEENQLALTYDEGSTSNDAKIKNNKIDSAITEGSTPSGSPLTGATELIIGNNDDQTRTWDGFLSRVKLSSIIRKDNWLKAMYNAEKENSTFNTVGSVVSQ